MNLQYMYLKNNKTVVTFSLKDQELIEEGAMNKKVNKGKVFANWNSNSIFYVGFIWWAGLASHPKSYLIHDESFW